MCVQIEIIALSPKPTYPTPNPHLQNDRKTSTMDVTSIQITKYQTSKWELIQM